MNNISVAEAKARFSELISRAAAGERFLIKRRSQPVAVVIGAAELDRLERRSEAAERLALALGQDVALVEQIEAGEVHPAMAAFGLWAEEAELEGLSDEMADNRRRQTGRPEVSL